MPCRGGARLSRARQVAGVSRKGELRAGGHAHDGPRAGDILTTQTVALGESRGYGTPKRCNIVVIERILARRFD